MKAKLTKCFYLTVSLNILTSQSQISRLPKVFFTENVSIKNKMYTLWTTRSQKSYSKWLELVTNFKGSKKETNQYVWQNDNSSNRVFFVDCKIWYICQDLLTFSLMQNDLLNNCWVRFNIYWSVSTTKCLVSTQSLQIIKWYPNWTETC